MNRQIESSSAAPTRVLVLDDDPGVGATIQRAAERAGYEVRHLTTADELFSTLPRWVPDLIVLDLMMPEMDGVEVIRCLAERGDTIPLILISGVGSRVLGAAERSANAHGLEIAGILAKPFTTAQLTETLSSAFAKGEPGESPVPKDAVTDNAPHKVPVSVHDLEYALEHGEIGISLQPKVGCRTGTLAGLEVLARWSDPEHGAIPPDIFIPLAEQYGLIDRLTRAVSDQALRWLAAVTADAGDQPELAPILGGLSLSINISAASLANSALFDTILQQCESYGIRPERIVLELTETSAMQDPVSALDNLTRLRLQGFQLSIDDFGTGYSSMAELVRLPFSEIKVDKSFVLTARDSADSRAVARSTIDLGRSLGLYATAEGVEDKWTMSFLAEAGCHFVQGFGIAAPMPVDAVLPWLREREAERESMRLQATRETALLDSHPEARFDRLVRLCRRVFDVPIAFVGLLDEDRLWFKSNDGFPRSFIPRERAFCNTTIAADTPLIIEDAAVDSRFRDSPLVCGSPFIRFYAGQPLCTPNGQKVGTLCLIDTQPRSFDHIEAKYLRELAAFTEHELATDRLSGRDPVTGLTGRESFGDQASSLLKLLARLGLGADIVVVRLLDLALINRSRGREAGDALLRALADIVRGAANPIDLVGRRRGTEFATFIADADDGVATALCEQIAAAVRQYNRNRVACEPAICCDLAILSVPPATTGRLDEIVREHAVSFATIIDDGREDSAFDGQGNEFSKRQGQSNNGNSG